MIEITYGGYLTRSVLEDACSRYGTKVNNLVLLRSALNSIYMFSKGFKSYYLRFTHSDYQDTKLVRAEIEWMDYLNKNSVSVARTIDSSLGNPVEIIPCERGYFSVACFQKAKGTHVKTFQWNENLFKELGTMTGRMHALAKEYKSPGGYRRKDFYRNDYITQIRRCLPKDEPEIEEKLSESLDVIKMLPVTKNTYGLMHNDIHRGNYFLKGNEITLIDFEDSGYSYFVYDIATQLYDALNPNVFKTFRRDSYIQYFLLNFMEGYMRENEIPEEQLEYMAVFMRLRSILDYASIHNIWNFKSLNQAQKNFAESTRTNIIEGFNFLTPELVG